LRHLSVSASRPASGWLTLLLLLAVLVPSACLLWFMNQAVRNERLALRQQLMDAYRDNLALARNRLDSYWNNAARAFDTNTLPAPALFAAAVRADVADAVICLDSAGKVVYPDAGRPLEREEEGPLTESKDPAAAAQLFAGRAADATNATLAARALQAEVRCLLQAGKKEEAIAVVTNSLAAPRFAQAADADGRWIVPNTELMALEAAGESRPLLELLRAQLLDYDRPMPAPQRRFLMRRTQQLFPRQPAFPTLAAEELAAAYLEERPTNLWQIAAGNGRVLLLFRTDSLPRRLRGAIGPDTALLSPGKETGNYLVADSAGTNLPGWRLALALNDRRFDAAAEAQIAAYFWVGILVLAAVAVLAVIAVRLIRRQVQAAQLRNDLVANVTHELKTPLSAMRLLVDTLLNAPVLHEPTARQYLQLIAAENLRLSRLIDNFLAFSRMERNKRAFDFAPTPPKEIVDSAAAAVRERFQPPECRFDARAAPDLPPISADAGALVTALLNLLDNAYKYSGDRKEITLRAEAGNGSVTFAVSDNGIGLAPRETKRIFKRFYQVDRRLARTGGGCGLGLSIVQFIVTAHQGTVRVESEPGRGSTFTISIPAAREAAATEGGR
jgi:signal transduction histidine kinase